MQKVLKSRSLTLTEHRQKLLLRKLVQINIYVTVIFQSMLIHMLRYLKHVTNDRLLPFAENGGNVEQKLLDLSAGLKTMVTVFFALTLLN